MDGKNNGRPYEQMDDLGGLSHIFGSTPTYQTTNNQPGAQTEHCSHRSPEFGPNIVKVFRELFGIQGGLDVEEGFSHFQATNLKGQWWECQPNIEETERKNIYLINININNIINYQVSTSSTIIIILLILHSSTSWWLNQPI